MKSEQLLIGAIAAGMTMCGIATGQESPVVEKAKTEAAEGEGKRSAPKPPSSDEAKPETVADGDGEAKPETEGEGTAVDSKPVLEQLKRLEAEKKAYALQVEHAEARLASMLLEKRIEVEKMKMEIEEIKARTELAEAKRKAAVIDELATLKTENEKLTLAVASAKARSEVLMYDAKTAETEMRSRISELTLAMEMIEKESDARNYTEEEPLYLDEPLDGKRLTISDRRIELNGSISSKTADHVCERIDYFNNKDKKLPIFIVIDNSPGGSVMSGYKILKAMHGSQAPVYVVVKQFAASMAACITTLADRSFAYPNAILLHHQLSGGVNGNLTQQREWVDEMGEWWNRLATPVAEKMGLTLEEFITKMYQNDSEGDWEEFADEAHKLKWVDHVIDEIRETSLYRNPDYRRSSPTAMVLRSELDASAKDAGTASPMVGESVDERGQVYYRLPRLSPPDLYWLYNPDGYYRLP